MIVRGGVQKVKGGIDNDAKGIEDNVLQTHGDIGSFNDGGIVDGIERCHGTTKGHEINGIGGITELHGRRRRRRVIIVVVSRTIIGRNDRNETKNLNHDTKPLQLRQRFTKEQKVEQTNQNGREGFEQGPRCKESDSTILRF